ncbi:hypothetical protein [Psychromonas antarctica]|jgi:hypothetical protein|uniref:hypothetical protein n=1 Tax=Psychromonas antarctica TaxID=67573 RepID=UPI001EE8817B|nr:hypothetical protein [Psychromonas antarctica]MCG6201420.1 hypothetical protein [Psychromonas antarctica]
MAVKKHKRKSVKQANKNQISKRGVRHLSLIDKHPRIFFLLGTSLLLFGILLVVLGGHNNAKVGLAMLAIFIGGATAVFANLALPKHRIKG